MKVLAWIPGTRAWRYRRDLALCKQTAVRIQEIVDGEIPADAAQLQRHLDACHRCQIEADALEELKAAIARIGGEAEPEVVAHLEELSRRLCRGEDC